MNTDQKTPEIIKKKPRYRHADGRPCIDVRVKNSSQLFDARDPSPFRDRDLDDDFVEYIMASAREIKFSKPFKIVIHVVEPTSRDLPPTAIAEAIHSFFNYQIELQSSNLKAFLQRAQVFLFIGLLLLGVCLGFAENIVPTTTPSVFNILREGLVIFGWVSIWKPIELVLFDWYPLYEKIKYYKKLARTEVAFQESVTN
jgi:hypothetical protein